MSTLGETGSGRGVVRLYARILQAMALGDAGDQARFLANAEVSNTGTGAFRAKTGICPAVMWWAYGDESFVAIYGATEIDQFRAVHTGYNASIFGPYEFPVNQAYVDCANSIADWLNATSFPRREKCVLAGYSMGGAIAPWLRKLRIGNGWFGDSPQVISIGAPRPANTNDCHAMVQNGPIWRWFSPGDPIPYVPMRASESAAFALYAGRFNSINYGRFTHAGNGLEARENAPPVEEFLPTGIAPISATNLANWWMAFMTGGQFTPHTLERFISLIPFTSVPVPFVRTHNDVVEPIETGSRRHTDAAVDRVGLQIATLERQQMAIPVRIPMERVFRAVRMGRVWGVYFGDVLICVRPGKRVARHIARSANEFIDRLQNAAVVNPDALVSQMTAYLAAASDPLGGFEPVMQINPPQ